MPGVDYSPFPDVEAVSAFAIARASTSLGKRVYSSVPNKPQYPLAVVKRLGGVPVERHRIDVARIQVDVYGDDKTSAREATDAARLALHRMEGTANTIFSAYVTAVDDEVGPAYLPDNDTGRDRYVFSVFVTLHHLDS